MSSLYLLPLPFNPFFSLPRHAIRLLAAIIHRDENDDDGNVAGGNKEDSKSESCFLRCLYACALRCLSAAGSASADSSGSEIALESHEISSSPSSPSTMTSEVVLLDLLALLSEFLQLRPAEKRERLLQEHASSHAELRKKVEERLATCQEPVDVTTAATREEEGSRASGLSSANGELRRFLDSR